MNNPIVYQQKRDRFGKFKSLNIKKFAKKVIIYQLIVLSIILNLYQFRQMYNIRCSVNSQVVGYFIKKSTCGDMEDNWFNATQNPSVLANNLDLYK